MNALTLILSNHLSLNLPIWKNHRKGQDIVLMLELKEALTQVPHHKKKVVFRLASQRHFAKALKALGYRVVYVRFEDAQNSGNLTQEVEKVIKAYQITRISVSDAADWQTEEEIARLPKSLGVRLHAYPDAGFLSDKESFAAWAFGKKQLRMEFFYRLMRQKHAVLLDGNKPVGGKWNLDAENRKPPKEGMEVPLPVMHTPDALTEEVISLVAAHFPSHFGDLEGFHYACTRQQAQTVLAHFIQVRLPLFGAYQDAMLYNEPWMYHSHISPYLNSGLLQPMECIEAACQAYWAGSAPLNAVEGFVRQILGWREFIRGIYWLKMPEYATGNFFQAHRSLPSWYWDGKTSMRCVQQCVLETKRNAYAHHIQRLMVLGNFALLAGIDPKEVNAWYLAVYIDAYEWVELPNVTGMILFADGGFLASKPYCAGGAYIHKMSNYCKGCRFSPQVKEGPNACPFNYLYWDFLQRNRQKLEKNPRLGLVYKGYDKMSEEKKSHIASQSAEFFKALEQAPFSDREAS